MAPVVTRAHGGGYPEGKGAAVVYLLLRGLPFLIPRWSYTFDRDGGEHGLLWELGVELKQGEVFHENLHGIYGSLAYYPADGRVTGRATYLLWLAPLNLWTYRFGFGGGAFVHRDGAGPSIESRLWVGWHDGQAKAVGLFASIAYEPDLRRGRHGAHLAIGIDAPLTF